MKNVEIFDFAALEGADRLSVIRAQFSLSAVTGIALAFIKERHRQQLQTEAHRSEYLESDI